MKILTKKTKEENEKNNTYSSHLTQTNIKQIKIIVKNILIGNLKLNEPYFVGKRRINTIYYVIESIENNQVRGYMIQSTNEPSMFEKKERTERKSRFNFKYI